MDELESIKSAGASSSARRHPEDVDSDNNSDSESTHLNHEHGTKDEDGDDDDEDQDDFDTSGPAGNMSIFGHRSHISLSGSFQTGVKGVLADAVSYETAKRRERTARVAPHVGYTEPAMVSPPPKRRASDGESGSDDDFVKTWRKNRLAELKTGNSTTRRQSPSKRKYGRVEVVDAAGYLDAVERVSPETIVVVTIYNDKSSESQFVEDCFNTLARRYVTTRFVKLHHLEAEMDPVVVPAVLAYKGGELFANIIRIVDEIPPGRNLSTDSLELVLRKANVLHKD